MIVSGRGEVRSVELWEDCATIRISTLDGNVLEIDGSREGAEDWLGKTVDVTVTVEEVSP